jgi:hypothetical protein
MIGLAARAARSLSRLFDDVECPVESGRGLQQRQQAVALAPGQARQMLEKLLELPGLHGASVNGSGRRWTVRLPKRFHT